MGNKKLYLYIAGGFVAAILVILLAIQSGFINFGGPSESAMNVYQQPYNPANFGTSTVTIPAGSVAPVSSSGQVLAPSGKVADNAAPAGAGDSPQETAPLAADQVPQGSVKINVLDTSFSPSSFSVTAGNLVTLTFTYKMTDLSRGAMIVFGDPSLSGILVVLTPGATKAISFNAPTKSGNYDFFVRGTDVKGTMIVK